MINNIDRRIIRKITIKIVGNTVIRIMRGNYIVINIGRIIIQNKNLGIDLNLDHSQNLDLSQNPIQDLVHDKIKLFLTLGKIRTTNDLKFIIIYIINGIVATSFKNS
jgi:hypothetical protein